MRKPIIILTLFACVNAYSQSKPNRVEDVTFGIKNELDNDSLSQNKVPSMYLLNKLLDSLNTLIYKAKSILGDGSLENPLRINPGEIFERRTTAELRTTRTPQYQIILNTTTGTYMYWDGKNYRQITTTIVR